MARVVREKTKVFSGNIGINTTSGTDVSNSLNQISSAANNASNAFFKRADEIAQQEGLDAGKDLNINEITTLDENTGKPVALSIPKTWGITRSKAFRDMVDKRFFSSIENEIRIKSKEFSQKHKRSGNYLANYRSSMKTYLSEMHQNSSGQYAEFIKEVGGNTIAATEPSILSYLESKHLSDTKSYFSLERSQLLQAYNATTDPNTKALLKKQLVELTDNVQSLGLIPKNSKEALMFELSSMDGYNTFKNIIGKTKDKNLLSNVQTFLLTNNPSLLNGFSNKEKKELLNARASLDNQQLNSINSIANGVKTRIQSAENAFESEQSNRAVENANPIVSSAQQFVFSLPLFDPATDDDLGDFLISQSETAFAEISSQFPYLASNPSVINRVKTNIRIAQTDRYLASAFGRFSDEEEIRFVELGGGDLINNAYYSLPGQQPTSDDDKNAYEALKEASPNFKNLFETIEELSSAGVSTQSITGAYNQRTKNWVTSPTSTELKKIKIVNNLTQNNGQVFDGSTEDYRNAAGDLMQTTYESSVLSEDENAQLSADWINDPTVFENQKVMDLFGQLLDKGTVPNQLIAAIKSNNMSETAYVLASIAQQHITYRPNDKTPVVRNVLKNVPGTKLFNEKLYAVNSLLKLGLTSPIPDYVNGKLVEGTGKAITSFTEAFELMNTFDIKDDSPFLDKLNRAAKFTGFKVDGNQSPLQQINEIIDESLIEEYPSLIQDFRNVTEYMLMVGTKFDKDSLKTMIKDYVEINTGSDGIVYDGFNTVNPHKSIFSLNQIFSQPEVAVAFTQSIEHLVNKQFNNYYFNQVFDVENQKMRPGYEQYNDVEDAFIFNKDKVQTTFFSFNPSGMTDREADDVYFKKRIDFDFGDLDSLSDDRVIMRTFMGGTGVTLEKKGGRYIRTYDPEGKGFLFNDPLNPPYKQELIDYYLQYEANQAEYSKNKAISQDVFGEFGSALIRGEPYEIDIGEDGEKLTLADNSTIRNMFLIPLPNKFGTNINAEESVFDITYMVAVSSPGGGLKPLLNPQDGNTFIINPKDFLGAVESFGDAYKKAIMTPGEIEAAEKNRANQNDPRFIRQESLTEKVVDSTIKQSIKFFNLLNNNIHKLPDIYNPSFDVRVPNE